MPSGDNEKDYPPTSGGGGDNNDVAAPQESGDGAQANISSGGGDGGGGADEVKLYVGNLDYGKQNILVVLYGLHRYYFIVPVVLLFCYSLSSHL
jgi:hypothetical protein